MNRRYYVFVALAATLAIATGTAGLLGNPGLSFWLGIMTALTAGYSLIVAMDRARDMKEKYADLDRTATGNYGEVKRLRAEAADTATVVAELRTLVKDNSEANADLVTRLFATETANKELELRLTRAEEKAEEAQAGENAVFDLATEIVQTCERLVEAAMAAEKAGQKGPRDEALAALVRYKAIFCENPWLLKQWYNHLPSFEQVPTAVLREFVQSETFLQRSGVHNNTPLHAELERALARKFV